MSKDSALTSSAGPASGLFIFTRYPVPGRAKTRLIPHLGEVGAANLQRQMTEHLVNRFQPLSYLDVQVHFAGGTLEHMHRWLGDRLIYIPQSQGDLGQRLLSAARQGFTAGLQSILMIGSDCPELSSAHLERALSLLRSSFGGASPSHDVVLGPALDGGYYLIGLNKPYAALFRDIPWGSNRVLQTTQAIARKQQLSVALLEPLADIDRPEDLHVWQRQLK